MLYLCEKNNIMGKGDRKTRKGKRFVGSSRKRTKLNCYGINKKEQKNNRLPARSRLCNKT